MNDNGKTIIFVGHFEIGEKFTKETQDLINFSKNFKNDIAILVNDIGLFQKYEYYSKKDIKGLIIEYNRRIWCAESECIISQLPKSDDEIVNIVDIEQFNFIKNYLLEKQASNNKIFSTETILNNEIIPILIQQRINDYSFKELPIKIFNEKHLRNVVERRIKVNKIKTWKILKGYAENSNGIYINNEMVINGNKHPVCRGITFAFFETIAELGYENIKFLIEKKHFNFLSK